MEIRTWKSLLHAYTYKYWIFYLENDACTWKYLLCVHTCKYLIFYMENLMDVHVEYFM